MPSNWLCFARDDVRMAELAHREGIYSQCCLHTQQAIEKSLKAFILFNGQKPPKIHNLDELLNACVTFDASLNAFRTKCTIVNQYYIPTRYPDMIAGGLAALPNQSDAQEALDTAKKVFKNIEAKMLPTITSSASKATT